MKAIKCYGWMDGWRYLSEMKVQCMNKSISCHISWFALRGSINSYSYLVVIPEELELQPDNYMQLPLIKNYRRLLDGSE